MRQIIVGTRGASTTLAAARWTIGQFKEQWPETEFKLQTVRGDPEGLNNALLANTISIAVLPLEHLPVTLHEDLELAAITKRGEAREALVARDAKSFAALGAGARVGAVGLRRLAFLKHHRPDLEAVELQGDAEAQLEAFANQGLDALVISAAALTHLGLRGRIAALLPSELFLPAPGQGALGLVVRHDDDIAAEVAYSLQHRPSDDRTSAERAFLQGLAVPNPQTVAALATLSDDGGLLLEGCLLGAAGRMIRASTEGEADEAETLGFELAEELLKQGGQELLDTP